LYNKNYKEKLLFNESYDIKISKKRLKITKILYELKRIVKQKKDFKEINFKKWKIFRENILNVP